MASQNKKLQVESLSQLLSTTNHFALVKFGNTSHQSLESLRKKLKKGGAKLRIIKLSLFEKAVNKLAQQQKDLKQLAKTAFPLKEDSALLTFGEDYLQGLNIFANVAKDEQNLSFRFGFLDRKIYPAEELEGIARFTGRDQLMAVLVASLKSSPTKLVSALKYNAQKLTYILKEKSKQT